MALMRTSLSQGAHLIVRGEGVLLRPFQMSDYGEWAQLRALSREHLVPWEPHWYRDELSRGAFRRRLRHYNREAREDQGYAFCIVEEKNSELVGGLTLTNVRRGVTQAASLGYWLGVPHTGRGIMTAAVRAIVAFSFETLVLHRLEAACMPENVRSMRLLEKTGFEREGFARGYLKINGAWRDHVLYGLVVAEGGSAEGERD